MGSAASKAAPKAGVRKYPSRAAQSVTQRSSRPAAARTVRQPSSPSARSPPSPKQTLSPQPTKPPSSSHSPPQSRPPPPSPRRSNASFTKDDAIRRDGADTDLDFHAAFASRLHQMGIVQPNPTFSATSKAHNPRPNTTLSVLEARRRLQDQADPTSSHHNRDGREFLAASTLREILQLRARDVDAATIEKRLRLKAGVVARLGPRGWVEAL